MFGEHKRSEYGKHEDVVAEKGVLACTTDTSKSGQVNCEEPCTWAFMSSTIAKVSRLAAREGGRRLNRARDLTCLSCIYLLSGGDKHLHVLNTY